MEKNYLRSLKKDIENAIKQVKESGSGISPADYALLEKKLTQVSEDLRKASWKSHAVTSLLWELKPLFQLKREAEGTDPEQPGKLLETFSAFLAKWSCMEAG